MDVLEKELAIHRGLIADENEGFNTEEFDAKWKQAASDEVNELMEATPGGVAVPADIPAETSEATAASTTTETPEAPAEDLNIEDDDFLAQLDEINK